MKKEKWLEIIGNIKDNFELLSHGSEHIDEEGGIDVEYVEFNGPMGKMKLEYITKPIIIDKKTNYSKRIGSETHIHYVYSDDEKSEKMIAYQWNDGDGVWVEMKSSMFS